MSPLLFFALIFIANLLGMVGAFMTLGRCSEKNLKWVSTWFGAHAGLACCAIFSMWVNR